ncbi:MAG: hypothetical protein HOP31_11245 [Ignavibacteria bacterium]|nr:hypothetical protein [Ignavibacteria bacterium]
MLTTSNIKTISAKRCEYNLIVLERGWVQCILKYIDSEELKNYIPVKYSCMKKINNDIAKHGICRIKIRKGFFKTFEFHITGIWDY